MTSMETTKRELSVLKAMLFYLSLIAMLFMFWTSVSATILFIFATFSSVINKSLIVGGSLAGASAAALMIYLLIIGVII